MGCTQSSPSGGLDGAGAGGKPVTTRAVRDSSSIGKAAGTPDSKVRDSVQDISPHQPKACQNGNRDGCKRCAKGEAGECSSPTHVDNAGTCDLEAATSAKGAGGLPHNTSDSSLAHGAGAGGGGGTASGAADPNRRGSNCSSAAHVTVARTGGASTADSNRSSFAAEGIPNGRGAARPGSHRGSCSSDHGHGGGVAGAGGAGRPSLCPPSDAVRSSQQARLSSIQAADVMGIGFDKGAPSARALPSTYDPLPGFTPPAPLAAAYPLLGALPPDTPVPLEVLARLWGAAGLEEALELARAFASTGILRLACLEDGSCWALPASPHVAHAAAMAPEQVAACHSQLLAAYTRRGEAEAPLEGLRDDGYIIQALSHHLVGCGRLADLRGLLMNPGWLEAKLHAYGVGAVVRDFRRYLQEGGSEEGSQDVKLLLQAFQLSLGAAMEHPTARMMREQMLARLMAVAAGGRLKEWYADQTAKCAAEGMLAVNSRLLHLMPRSPSLAQAGGVQRMTLRGHQAPIRRVAIAPNCCDVVTISEDGSAHVWDMNIGDCVMQLAREAPLTAVGVTPDSGCAVVGAADGTAAVWNLATGQVVHTLAGHTAKINALAIDKQGIRVVTASDDRTARVWNLHDGTCEAVLRGHGSAAGVVGAVLDVCVCADGTLAVSVSDDWCGRVWDLDEDGEQLHVLEGHGGWVTSAAFVGTSHRVITASHDSTARLWDALKGRCLAVLSGHTGRLNRVCVDPGGSWAVTCSDDNTARVWDAEGGELKLVLEGHSSHVADAAITRDGRKAITVSGDGTCCVWDLDSGRREAVLEGHTGEVACVVLTQRGRFAVTAGEDCTARVWDLAAAAADAAPPPPTHGGGRVAALGCVPGGGLVVSAGEDGRLFLWDPVEGTCLKRMEGHRVGVRFMRVAEEGGVVLTGSGDRQICRWNLTDYSAAATEVHRRRSLERRDLLLGTYTTAAGSNGGHSVATTAGTAGGGGAFGVNGGAHGAAGGGGGAAGGVCSPLLSSGGDGSGATPAGANRQSEDDDPAAALAALRPAATAPPPAVPSAASARTTSPSPLGLTPTPTPPRTAGVASAASAASAAASCGTRSSLLDLVSSLQTDPLRASMPAQQGSRVKHLAFDAACRHVAVLLYDSTVSVWDVEAGRVVSQLIKRGERDASRTHSGGVNAVLLSRDARTAVTISKDNTARVWDVPSASTRFVVEGHTDGLVAADLSRDEALLATAAFDRTVRVSRLANGSAVAVLDHPQPPVTVAFSPDGRRMAVGLEDHSVVVWDLVGRCCLPSLDAHKAALSVLAWSPDSRFLATAGADCTLRLWRAADGRQTAFFMADAAITAACFAGHPVSDILVAGDAAGAVHFLDWSEELQE